MQPNRKIRLAVIGATGSVGRATLDICRRFRETFDVVAVAARTNAQGLFTLATEFQSRYAYLQTPSTETIQKFQEKDIELLAGDDGLSSIASLDCVDHVVFASSGTDAIVPLKHALLANKNVSLANKESIVAAGPWIMPLVRRPDQLRPIDSEHSAIWQCLRDEPAKGVRKILLTASGGPFREWSLERMRHITPSDALKHPVWAMGAKITVDSATLMNKGIECIEAMQLFNLSPPAVGALIHPKSLVHGIVEFTDATMKLLLSQADMRLPAAAAIAWPERLPLSESFPLDFCVPSPQEWALTFSEPDHDRFPCLRLAIQAVEMGEAYPPLLVGADQFAVGAFLEGRIPFLMISNIIERTMERFSGCAPKSIEDAIALISEGERISAEVYSATGG
ncbi:1-deoxy-D-xylulose-5-phosphate reductoisomerase [Synergistaceae bacterium OttesenSCG-928-I11]|nr:1-deoxy-D-xylulose-5-phosphate reductoisomerase [Synergistaceae bacterium OttesenSCG-928-I11]